MSNATKITVRTGFAPQGSTVTEWDSYWTDEGKAYYEYQIVPAEAVSGEVVAYEDTLHLSFDEARQFTHDLVEALGWEGCTPADLEQVYMVNITNNDEGSFICTTWNVLDETLLSL